MNSRKEVYVMRKRWEILVCISLIAFICGCDSKSNTNDDKVRDNTISIIDNMKAEAKDELDNMFNYNSSGYTYVNTGSVFDNEVVDSNMVTTGVYKFVEDNITYYYFRGNVENNYLKFGKNAENEDMYWRIMRTNKDNTLRLVYYGVNTEYEDKAIGSTIYHSNTGKISDANYSTSNVKTLVEDWYQKNIIDTGYDKYVVEEDFICDTSYKMEKLEETFNSVYRTRYNYFISDKAYPSLSVKEGAENLKLKVGIINADEALMAGINSVVGENDTNKSYIKNSKIYWTMSPQKYYASSPNKDNGTAYILLASSAFTAAPTNIERSVIPVINLGKEALEKIVGKGTKEEPYELK